MEGFLLGLSSGTFCIIHCAPVAIPFLFSENGEWKDNSRNVLLFITGRLIGYIIFGAILGFLGAYTIGYVRPVFKTKITSIVYILIGTYMLLSGLMYNLPKLKICRVFKKIYKPERSAVFYGLLTGLSLCPPFFAAAARVFEKSMGVFSGAFYFLTFFLGTSIFLLPLLGIPLLRKHMKTIHLISRIVLVLMGSYFLFFIGFLTLT